MDLLRKGRVEHAADLEILLDGALDLVRGPVLDQCLHHQDIELGVLRLLHPMVLQEALELRIEILVVRSTTNGRMNSSTRPKV